MSWADDCKTRAGLDKIHLCQHAKRSHEKGLGECRFCHCDKYRRTMQEPEVQDV